MLKHLKGGRLAFARVRDEQASTIVEFALLFTVLMPLLMGIIVFGVAFSNYLALTNATASGAQQVAQSRGQNLDPCSVVDQAILSQTPFNLPRNQSGLQFSMVLNPPTGQTVPNPTTTGGSNATYTGSGTSFSCLSGSNTTGSVGNMMVYGTLSVTVTYPCSLVVYGVDFAPGCKLTAATQEAIE